MIIGMVGSRRDKYMCICKLHMYYARLLGREVSRGTFQNKLGERLHCNAQDVYIVEWIAHLLHISCNGLNLRTPIQTPSYEYPSTMLYANR